LKVRLETAGPDVVSVAHDSADDGRFATDFTPLSHDVLLRRLLATVRNI